MNYIKQLQESLVDKTNRIDHTSQEIMDFRSHLRSAKFTTPAQDGSRVDWISTADVEMRLQNILDTLRGIA